MLLLQAFAAWDVWNQSKKKIMVTFFSLLIIILAGPGGTTYL